MVTRSDLEEMYGLMYGYLMGEGFEDHGLLFNQEDIKELVSPTFDLVFGRMLDICERATLLDEDSTFKDLVARYREAFEGRNV